MWTDVMGKEHPGVEAEVAKMHATESAKKRAREYESALLAAHGGRRASKLQTAALLAAAAGCSGTGGTAPHAALGGRQTPQPAAAAVEARGARSSGGMGSSAPWNWVFGSGAPSKQHGPHA